MFILTVKKLCDAGGVMLAAEFELAAPFSPSDEFIMIWDSFGCGKNAFCTSGGTC